MVDVDFEIVFQRFEREVTSLGGGFEKVEVIVQEVEQFGLGGSVRSETIGVLEHAAANHETVDRGELVGESEGGGAVFDVAVDNKLGFGAELGAQLQNFRDELVVGGNFTHLLFGAKMDGESGGMEL